MKRVTREKVSVDCVAYQWVIRNFVDLEREFIVYDALYAECLRQVNPS